MPSEPPFLIYFQIQEGGVVSQDERESNKQRRRAKRARGHSVP
jgi:hypothetical protein